jgi:hypothetical protein
MSFSWNGLPREISADDFKTMNFLPGTCVFWG